MTIQDNPLNSDETARPQAFSQQVSAGRGKKDSEKDDSHATSIKHPDMTLFMAVVTVWAWFSPVISQLHLLVASDTRAVGVVSR